MNVPRPSPPPHPADVASVPAPPQLTNRDQVIRKPAQTGQRKFDIMILDPKGQVREFSTILRAHHAYENAFAVLSHNAVVQTQNGMVAVEDVIPGDKVRLSDGTFDTVLWRGRTSMNTHDDQAQGRKIMLTRFTTDAMGEARPAQDVVLGSGARIVYHASGLSTVTGTEAAFLPASDLIDDNTVVRLHPAQRISLFQFGFAKERAMRVNGLDVGSLHPGSAFDLALRGDALREYLSLFPHKRGFEDFGMTLYPRLRLHDLDLLS